MPKKTKKELFKIPLGNKKVVVTKTGLEWVILVTLVALVIMAQVSGLYPYIYNYAKCGDAPLEIRGSYYKIPYDNTYGIHMGSSYDRCFGQLPTDLQRDPSTKVGAAMLKKRTDAESKYNIYTPSGYEITKVTTSELGSELQTTFSVTTSTHHKFNVREMGKDSVYSYVNLCYKPVEENWSGTIIGKDSKGREICKTNPSKYVTSYFAGITIGKTVIMLQAHNDSIELLNNEATAIFSSMELYSGNK